MIDIFPLLGPWEGNQGAELGCDKYIQLKRSEQKLLARNLSIEVHANQDGTSFTPQHPGFRRTLQLLQATYSARVNWCGRAAKK